MKMKLVASLLLSVTLLWSCGDKAAEEKKGEEKESTESTENTEEEEETSSETIECGQPMMSFLGMMKGSYTDVEAALDQYGAEGLDRVDMDMYDLQEPKVVACTKSETGECCTMEAKAGMTIRTYDICWENDKITSIVDKGMR